MSYWPVGSKFIGVAQPREAAAAPVRKHHIWIEDQSGSLGWATDLVAEDICTHLQEIPLGDIVSIGYFSGVGDYRWFVKGTKLGSSEDYANVSKIVRQNARSRNTTCFSQILADVKTVIADTAPLADAVELVFLTDGHPVVPNYQSEHRDIFKAIQSIKGDVSSALLVGYGDYYNRPLMVEMAQALGATLQHAEEIRDFGKRLGEIVIKSGRKRTTITLPKGTEAAFTIENGRVVIYSVDNNAVVAPADLPVYYVSSTSDGKSAEKSDKNQDRYQAAYALALLFLQQGNVDEALAVLSDVGDVYLVDKLSAAMTNKEFGDVENLINDAAVDLSKRFLRGQKKGCAPKGDAFDLIDLLNLLQGDKAARFYPNHPDFKYKRIGRKSKTVEGYPTFQAAQDASVPISSLVGNARELNISIGVSIPGTVILPDESYGFKREAVGLPEVFNAHVFRTYNLVSNALPNVAKLPASVSEDTHRILVENGVLPQNSVWQAGEVYTLDLLAVPACNRERGKSAIDFNDLARLSVDSLILGNQIKVLKDKLNELDPDKESARPVSMTPEQEKFLEGCGIKSDGTYSPPTILEEPTDVLTIRTFETKIAKSSPVSVADFKLMLSGDKKLNWVGAQMMLASTDIDKNMPQKNGAAVQWLNDRLDELKGKKRSIDNEVNARRYAIALGGHWKKYHNASEATYTVDSTDWTFSGERASVTFVFNDNVQKKI